MTPLRLNPRQSHAPARFLSKTQLNPHIERVPGANTVGAALPVRPYFYFHVWIVRLRL